MTINLENVDLIRERTGASYKEAKEALEASNGDVLEAIIFIEEKPKHGDAFAKGMHDFGKDFGKGFHGFGADIMVKLKELVKAGNVSRITLEKEDKVLIDIPVNVGAVGAVLFPPATVVAIIAALATGCSMKILKTDGETIDIKEVTTEALKQVMDKVENHGNCCCNDNENEEKCCDDDKEGCCSGNCEESPKETDEEENVVEIEPKDE